MGQKYRSTPRSDVGFAPERYSSFEAETSFVLRASEQKRANVFDHPFYRPDWLRFLSTRARSCKGGCGDPVSWSDTIGFFGSGIQSERIHRGKYGSIPSYHRTN